MSKKERKDVLIIYRDDDELQVEIKQKEFGLYEKTEMVQALSQIIQQMTKAQFDHVSILNESINAAYEKVSEGDIDDGEIDPLSMLTILKKIM